MPDDLTERVIRVIADTQKIPVESITPDSSFEALKIDSLDAINILFALENEFDISIPDDDARAVRSLTDLVALVERLRGHGAAPVHA
ncbi:MAG TPA: acyl carrier protein [Bryobacteraceae bacterium]|nr:acyl carrier protein [Bryobacteraceae bacterium]